MQNTLRNRVAENLRALRESSGETQADLAKVLNVRNTAVSKYEKDGKGLSLETINAIARHYGITVDQLLRESIDPAEDSPITLSDFIPFTEAIFPLFDANAPHGSEFRKAYNVATSIFDDARSLQPVLRDSYLAKWEMAVSGFYSCMDGDFKMEAVANLVTLVLHSLAVIPDAFTSELNTQLLSNPSMARKDLRRFLRNVQDKTPNDFHSGRREASAEIDDDLFELLRMLKQDPDWSDLAQFHVANIYFCNLYDSGGGLFSNRDIGFEMHLGQMKLLNEYSLRLIKLLLGLYPN